MKQHIAKLLVFLMLMTTTLIPVNGSFAEEVSNDEQAVSQDSKVDESNALAEQDKSVDRSEQKEIVSDVNDEMKFLYIESKELESPGTQNIPFCLQKSFLQKKQVNIQ